MAGATASLRKIFAARPDLRSRYLDARSRLTRLRASQYDISDRCNLSCTGCLYFEGNDRDGTQEQKDLDAVERFFAAEAARGVNFAYVAGAEPSMARAKLKILARHIPRGVLFTNGVIPIDPAIPYRIHVSLWALPGEQTIALRGDDNIARALKNYRDDPRAVFAFTINRLNLGTIPAIARFCRDQGVRLTFGHFSPTFPSKPDQEAIRLRPEDLHIAQRAVDEATASYPETVIYHPAFNQWAGGESPLYRLGADGIAIDCGARTNDRLQHFRADLQQAAQGKCCMPNIDCRECRVYTQAYATALARIDRYCSSPERFEEWLAIAELWRRLFL